MDYPFKLNHGGVKPPPFKLKTMKYKTVLKEVASRQGKNILDYKEDGKYDKAPALYRYINTTIPNAIQRIKKPLEFFAKDVKVKIEVDGEDFLID